VSSTNTTELRSLELFHGLTDAQLEQLYDVGSVIAVVPGRELFHEGDHADHWWVLLDGAVDLTRRVGREETQVGRMDAPGRWAGGFQAWDEHGVYLATARGAIPGRVLQVPAPALRDLLQEWFPFGVHLVAGLYRTARSIEATARQRESLVTLGTLSAGLAHELNNPASAASRAAESLDRSNTELLDALTHLATGGITSAQFVGLDELRRQLRRPPVGASALAVADREDALATWLEARGLDNAWELAPALDAAGADPDWCDRVEELVAREGLAAALRWAAATATVATLLGEVREATRRVSELVSAVRSYTQMDRAERQRIDVTEGLESTLVMLGHRLPPGITVVRDYGTDVPPIEAYAGELNQVWTNLLTNAIDAVGADGTITVATRAEEGAVVVEVADTGPGFTPEARARAFEPFFTTKEVGQGTGLGLDIARHVVVDRHGGDIEIDSEPGHSVLRVRLRS